MVTRFKAKKEISKLDPKKIIEDAKRSPSAIYIFIGPHPIVAPIIEELIDVILPNGLKTTNLDILKEENAAFSTIVGAFNSQSFFGGRKILWVRISKFDKEILSWLIKGKFNADKKILIFELETLALEKSELELFRQVYKKGIVVDFSLDDNSGIRQLIYSWLKEYGKKINFKALDAFCNQVGEQDLVAIKNEVEKLVAAIGDKSTITLEDIDSIVVRHRQEALFELTQAIGEKDFSRSLTSFYWLIDQGIHPLAIIASLSLYVRRLSLIRQAIEDSVLKKNLDSLSKLDFNRFKSSILPVITEYYQDDFPKLLKNFKPYAQYKLFLAALNFSLETLLFMLVELSKLDIALKNSDPNIITRFENFFATLTQKNDKEVMEVR